VKSLIIAWGSEEKMQESPMPSSRHWIIATKCTT